MRGLTSTILLVVVLAGLGGYIYFVENKKPAGGADTPSSPTTSAATIARLTTGVRGRAGAGP